MMFHGTRSEIVSRLNLSGRTSTEVGIHSDYGGKVEDREFSGPPRFNNT